MSMLAMLMAVAGTWLAGAALCMAVMRNWSANAPARHALALGAGYPVGALLVAAWMTLLAAVGIRASSLVAVAPVVAAVAYALWRSRHRLGAAMLRRALRGLSGGWLDSRERWIWIALVAWIGVRFVLLAIEISSRPPLAWEAWLHAAGRARIWHALREPVAFVPEALWWQGTGYLAGLAGGSRLTPPLDAWTTFAIGRFDDTMLHVPWLAFLAAQALLAYAALRHAAATPVAALAAAALVVTIPLSNAHAALGGTGALPLATCYLGAFVMARRWSLSQSIGDAVIAALMLAGMLAAGGGAGAVWAATLVPFFFSRLPGTSMERIVAAIVAIAAIAAIVVARNRLFATPGLQDVPVPGIAALAQHALLLGNWHVLSYAAAALAVLASRVWRSAAWLPATATMALGVVALVMFATSVGGRTLVGSTGAIGHAATTFAPVLAVWVALIAHAWWLDGKERAAANADASAIAHSGPVA